MHASCFDLFLENTWGDTRFLRQFGAYKGRRQGAHQRLELGSKLSSSASSSRCSLVLELLDPSSSSSACSCASFGSFDEDVVAPSTTTAAATPSASRASSAGSAIKFLCSYGGKILPRYPDGKLRYVGGDTRVLSVDRSIPFSELQEKMREMCGWDAVSVRCQLPTEDLDALVSLKSDEDLANLVEEYDLAGRRDKIRAFLFSLSVKPSTPPPLSTPASSVSAGRMALSASGRCVHQISSPWRLAGRHEKAGAAADLRHHAHHLQHHHHHHHLHGHHGILRPCDYLVHHGSQWQ